MTAPTWPVDYATTAVPASYACARCGATGCKLWRLYQTFLDHQELTCCDCAAKAEGKDASGIDATGKVASDLGGRTDQIGWRIPAVPTEDGSTFWGYTSVPDAGVAWWTALPTRRP